MQLHMHRRPSAVPHPYGQVLEQHTIYGRFTPKQPTMQGLQVKVWRDYSDYIEELSARFPYERAGIQKFYDECWRVFNALNSLDLKSLEEPRYLLGGVQLAEQPFRHLSLASSPAAQTRPLSIASITEGHCLTASLCLEQSAAGEIPEKKNQKKTSSTCS